MRKYINLIPTYIKIYQTIYKYIQDIYKIAGGGQAAAAAVCDSSQTRLQPMVVEGSK